jgi:acyl-CoA reductase-like NAD-dependent aldehyde dehydrogenase
MAAASGSLKRLTLELGGKSPNIVFADADIEATAAASVFAIYYSSGQSCEARSRILVHQDACEAFTKAFVAKASQLRQGDPTQADTQMGALISAEHTRRVHGFVERGVAAGATLALGGNHEGNFYKPTVLTDVKADNPVFQEEVFGPVVTITPFADEAEAIRLANGVAYGLFATIWTREVGRAHRVAAAIKAGGVAINTPFTAFPGLPFGGYKQSGVGRELSMGSLDAYTEEKVVLVNMTEKTANPFGL